MKTRALSALAAALAMLAATGPAWADDKDVIEYRRHIMKSLNEQSAILGQIASGLAPADNVVAHLDTVALLASTALKAFEPKVPGGESKPAVWKDWKDFSERMQEFAQQTDAAAKLARTDGPEPALTNMLEAMSCRGCHKVYREEKK